MDSVDINKTLKTLVMWELTLEDISKILSISEKSINIFGCTCTTRDFTDEQLQRIHLVKSIQSIIDLHFSNPENQQKFMTLKNHHKPFNGSSPATFIKEGQLERLIQAHSAILNIGTW